MMKRKMFALFLTVLLLLGGFGLADAKITIDAQTGLVESDGNSTRPAIAFLNEPTLGFYRLGAGIMGLAGGNLDLGTGSLLLDSIKIHDSDDSHYLEILTNSNLTDNRILTLTTGDAARTITLSGNPTLADWFDQSVKIAGTPTFAGITISGLTDTRVPFAGVAGLLSDDADMTFITDTLTVTKGVTPTSLTVGASATQDRIIIQGVAKGANQFDGTLSLLDLTAARAWNLPDLDGTIALTANKLSAFAATTSAELAGVISDETGSGLLVYGTQPTFITDITAPTVYGSASASGTLTLTSTSHGTKGNTLLGRLTLSDLANSDGIVFGSLGTATKAIDLSGSNLSGDTDYQIYIGASDYWTASGILAVTGNVGINTSTFGTSLAAGLAMGNGTAPTTYPANIFQLWAADEGGRDGYSHPHIANEAGQNGAIAIQAPLVNLLSNSGFGVWSNATLENVGSQLVASWTNADYDTFTSTGADIDSAVYTTSGTQDASSAAITLVSGKLYKIVVTLTLTSGQAPTLAMTNLGHTSAAISAGANTFIREATSTTTALTVSNTAASNWSATFTLYEVTPGFVAIDSLGPDGWGKQAAQGDIWREHSGSYTKDGSFYALKATVDEADKRSGVQWPSVGASTAQHYKKFAGKTITIGAWMYTDVADKGTTSYHNGSAWVEGVKSHSGSGTYEWIENTFAVPSNITGFTAGVGFPDTVNTHYISQPMLVFGPAIGAGNYAPSPNETIYTEKVIALTDYTATTSAADATINLEAQSSGFIPKGVKAVLVKAYAKDSAAADGIGFDVQSASGVEDGISIDTQVNNVRVQGQGWVKADANGDIYFDHRGSGASALTVDIKVIGIQP